MTRRRALLSDQQGADALAVASEQQRHRLMFILTPASMPSELRLSGVPAEVKRQQRHGGQ
jgi:hypothetical protein